MTATQPIALERCAACRQPLTAVAFSLPDRMERFCAACVAQRPRCDGCGAPVGDQHWTLHDGRRLCGYCYPTAVLNPHEAQQLFETTVAAVVAQLNLQLRVGVMFRMVDAPTLAGLRGSDQPHQRTLGLYQRSGSLRVIYLLYGLPRLTFRTVVAHEYAHAWQGEHCPLLEDEALREGFAEWVAYRHLLYLGCTKAARQMLAAAHPYRPFLEQVLTLEARSGPTGVLAQMLAAGRGVRGD